MHNTVEPVLNSHPQGIAGWPLNSGWPLNKGWPMPFHSTVDHWFYKNLLKNTTKIDLVCMSIFLYEWSHFKWSFNTGGKQYKQATGTQLKGDTTA